MVSVGGWGFEKTLQMLPKPMVFGGVGISIKNDFRRWVLFAPEHFPARQGVKGVGRKNLRDA